MSHGWVSIHRQSNAHIWMVAHAQLKLPPTRDPAVCCRVPVRVLCLSANPAPVLSTRIAGCGPKFTRERRALAMTSPTHTKHLSSPEGRSGGYWMYSAGLVVGWCVSTTTTSCCCGKRVRMPLRVVSGDSSQIDLNHAGMQLISE